MPRRGVPLAALPSINSLACFPVWAGREVPPTRKSFDSDLKTEGLRKGRRTLSLCPESDSNRHERLGSQLFESCVSTNSTIRAKLMLSLLAPHAKFDLVVLGSTIPAPRHVAASNLNLHLNFSLTLRKSGYVGFSFSIGLGRLVNTENQMQNAEN